jgi:hypothetical protein
MHKAGMEKKAWTVVQHSGHYAIFRSGTEKKTIDRPSDPEADAMFMRLREGMVVDERALQLFLRPKIVAKR